MGTPLTEGKYAAEFLLSEGNGSISREQIVLAAAATALVPGTVLGKITASGKYVAYSNVAVDGTEVARGILYAGRADSAADQGAVMIVRDAEVIQAELTGIDATGITDLAALGIICR